MRGFLWTTLFLIYPAISSALETVAWKIPAHHHAVPDSDSKSMKRLQGPPEASPFFNPGDELWDLSEIIPANHLETDRKPEWIVWNKTTGCIVSKADLTTFWELDVLFGREKIPVQCRLEVELFEVPPDGAPLTDASLPNETLSWIVLREKTTKASTSSPTGSLAIEATVGFDRNDPYFDLSFHGKAELPGQPPVSVTTSFTLAEGTPLWVARKSDGEKGMDFRVTARAEQIDGSPYAEAVMILRDGKAEPLLRNLRGLEIREAAGGWLATHWYHRDGFEQLMGMKTVDPDADPFAVEPEEFPKNPEWLEIPTPENLGNWLPSSLIEITKALESSGIDFTDESGFAGYDPLTQTVVMFSKKSGDTLKFEQFAELFTGGEVTQLVLSLEDKGSIRVVARSGQRAEIVSGNPAKGDLVSKLLIEPTIGESGDLIDLTLDYMDNSAPDGKTLETTVLLREGAFSDLIDAGANENSGLRVKAEILKVPDPGDPTKDQNE